MIDILSSIGDAIYTLFQLIINTITSVLWVIVNIGEFQSTIVALTAYCPSFILVFLEVSLALTIVFAIFKLL